MKKLVKGIILAMFAFIFIGVFSSCELAMDLIKAKQDESNNGKTNWSIPFSVGVDMPTNSQLLTDGFVDIQATATGLDGIQKIVVYNCILGGTTNTHTIAYNDNPIFTNTAWNVDLPVDGVYRCWATAENKDGDTIKSEVVEYSAQKEIFVDTTPPNVTITSHVNNQIIGKSYTLSGTATDNIKVSYVYVKTDDGSYSNATLGGSDTSKSWSLPITLATEGFHTNYVYAVDSSGNISTSTQTVIVEYEAGVPSINITSPTGGYLTSVSVNITGTASVDIPDAITSVQVKIGSGGTYANATGTTSWSKNESLGQGENTIYAKANADNGKNAEVYVTVTVDSIIPTCAISSPANNATISNSTITVSGTASDGTGTGVKEVWVDCSQGFSKATGTTGWSIQFTSLLAGNCTIKAYSVDYAGNISSTNTISITIVEADSTPPTLNVATTTHTTNISSTMISGTASDSGSGVYSVFVKVGTSEFAGATGTTSWSKAISLNYGANSIYVYARDNAGNHSATNTFTITYQTNTSGMIVYFKKPATWPGAYIHYWDPAGSTWGQNPAMTDVGDGWYSYAFADRTSTSLLFKDVAGTNVGHQSADTARSGDGWYWTNNQWYPTNPESSTTPVLVIGGPSDYRTVTSDNINFFGTAAGGGGITAVKIRVNGGAYSDADGTGSWTKNVALHLGTNIIDIYAKGASGFDSAVQTRHVIRNTSTHDDHPGTYSGKLGANVYANGVEFSIWWRNSVVDNAWVSGTFNGWAKTQLTRITSGNDTDIWWAFVPTANAGDEYKFIGHKTGGDVTVTDPYANYARYSGGAAVVVDHSTFTWTDGTWNRPGWDYYIIYEAHIKDFTTHASSGVTSWKKGKYVGFIEKLQYIEDLGITAIHFMPNSEFGDGGYSWGYETCLFLAPESGYAVSPLDAQDGVDEFKQLIDACHSHGIAVIMDMVFNHTDNDDNWLWQTDDVGYFDYDDDGVVEAESGGDDSTPWGNRLCTWKENVKRLGRQTIEMFMTEYHVDGFRFDATHTWFIDHSFLMNLKSHATSIDPDVYFVYENLPNQSDLKTWGAQWADEYHDWGKKLFKGEASASDMQSHIYYNNDEGWAASPVESMNYLESHDEETLAYATGSDHWKQRAGVVLLATSLGTPMIWMGQEFVRSREAQNTDEAPLDWNLQTANVDMYNYYAGVFNLRKNNPALRQSTAAHFNWQYGPSGNVIGYSHGSSGGGDKKFVVLLNFGSSTATGINLGFPETGTWTKVVTEQSATGTDTINVTSGSYSVDIMGNSGIIFMK